MLMGLGQNESHIEPSSHEAFPNGVEETIPKTRKRSRSLDATVDGVLKRRRTSSESPSRGAGGHQDVGTNGKSAEVERCQDQPDVPKDGPKDTSSALGISKPVHCRADDEESPLQGAGQNREAGSKEGQEELKDTTATVAWDAAVKDRRQGILKPGPIYISTR